MFHFIERRFEPSHGEQEPEHYGPFEDLEAVLDWLCHRGYKPVNGKKGRVYASFGGWIEYSVFWKAEGRFGYSARGKLVQRKSFQPRRFDHLVTASDDRFGVPILELVRRLQSEVKEVSGKSVCLEILSVWSRPDGRDEIVAVRSPSEPDIAVLVWSRFKTKELGPHEGFNLHYHDGLRQFRGVGDEWWSDTRELFHPLYVKRTFDVSAIAAGIERLGSTAGISTFCIDGNWGDYLRLPFPARVVDIGGFERWRDDVEERFAAWRPFANLPFRWDRR